MKKSVIVLTCLVALAFAAPVCIMSTPEAQAAEQNFIRMVVPHAAGAGVDTQARLLGDKLGGILGKPVVIENIPGAGGIKGINEIVRAPKDGLTIGLSSNNIVTNPSLYKDLPYDTLKDITPISIVVIDVLVLVVNPSLPVANVQELIAMAKAQPGALDYGSSGNGTVLHLSAELFCREAGIKLTHIPYKGGSQLTTDLLGGHVKMAFLGLPQCVQQVKAGTLKALAVTTPKRSDALPDVPTLAESGLPNYVYEIWAALIGPAGMPPQVVQKLNAAMQETLKLPEIRDTYKTLGTIVVGSTPEEAAAVFKRDLEKSAALIKESGIVLE